MQLLPERASLRSLPAISFATLMELYEANYIRFRRLAPRFDVLAAESISASRAAPQLHLHIVERSRHTSTVLLAHGAVSGPDCVTLTLRVYHDARLVEALSLDGEPADLIRAGLIERWKRNRILYRWLAYYRSQGHRFDSGPDSLSAEVTCGQPA